MSDLEWDEIINLAKRNGCDPDNPCWQDCLDEAFKVTERHG